VIEPSSGHVDQINGEELDDEEVIVRLICPACEAVVLHSNNRIDFAIKIDDVVGHPKTLREAHVAHVAPEHFSPWPLGAKAAPFSITAPTGDIGCVHGAWCMPLHPPPSHEPNDVPVARGVHSGGSAVDGTGLTPVKM
jgi:hypothetical protein